jgi:hypothetical protein
MTLIDPSAWIWARMLHSCFPLDTQDWQQCSGPEWEWQRCGRIVVSVGR